MGFGNNNKQFDYGNIIPLTEEKNIDIDEKNKMMVRKIKVVNEVKEKKIENTYIDIRKMYKKGEEWNFGKGIWIPIDIAEDTLKAGLEVLEMKEIKKKVIKKEKK